MKVLFLDFDGVITTTRAHVAFHEQALITRPDPVACLLVARICEETETQIVISSSWRNRYNHDALSLYLIAQGIAPKHFHDDFFTPNHPSYDKREGPHTKRGEEIEMWLQAHPDVEKYCIVDDDGDMLPSQKQSFVKTNTYDGLSFDNYLECLKILGKKE